MSAVWQGVGDNLTENTRYTYDNKGNITEIRENGLLVNKYTYDSLSRLIREDNIPFNKTTKYSYDNGGNITNVLVYDLTLDSLDTKLPTTANVYGYNSNGWKDQLMSYNNKSFAYDNLGNPTIYKDNVLTWEYGRLLASYNANTYS